MSKIILKGLAVALAGLSVILGAGAQVPLEFSNQSPPHFQTVLNRYCVTCHNERLKTAGLVLEGIDIENISEGAPVWEKVLRKLRAGQMPPAGMPRPDQATYDSFATYLEAELDNEADVNPNPGRIAAAHRLNRTEYTNAVRDLFALEMDGGSLLPTDDNRYGFDNISDALTISPSLMERYLSAAEKIARLAVGDTSIPAALETYEISDNFMQQDHVSEDLPFGSRGGIAIRHYFPLDGEYLIKFDLRKVGGGLYAGQLIGFQHPNKLDIRLDGARVGHFTIGGENRTDEGLEVRIPVKAGMRVVGVSFEKESMLPEGASRNSRVTSGLSAVTIGGPYESQGAAGTASRQKIFLCRPTTAIEEEPCALEILSFLARRAYRRPVSDGDVQPLLELYRAGLSRGGFEAGIQMAVQGILVSPAFLFQTERDPEHFDSGPAYPISDIKLASRLSFFLWSSIPDDELLDLAEQGALSNPVVLERQVHRMLADPRSKALVRNFGEQWLQTRSVPSKSVDRGTFRDFDENLREALQWETELFFESIVGEDRSVVDLLGADYTFLNERLAQHYGISGIYGSQFRRVNLGDEARKGLLGQGSILMVTSYNTRTSPVLRGKWVLENILGTPPPPPPPNVPSLKDNQDTRAMTMRERMAQHSTNPVCASCHKMMDPLGFALENFDAIGRWRTKIGDKIIDVSGELPDGTKFQGPVELREILLNRQEEFVDTFTERLLTYALGRGVEYFDRPAIRKILREAAPDYRWSALTLGIVKSIPFRMRRPQTP